MSKKRGNMRAKSTDIKKRMHGVYKISNRDFDLSHDQQQMQQNFMRNSGNFTDQQSMISGG